jgi:hypothetical protein
MRVNLFAGPSAGKSLLAAHLFDRLRQDGFGIELVTEAIKPKAYRGEAPAVWASKDVFDEQLRRERDWIYSGVPHLVTDSPVLLQCYYMRHHGVREAAGCLVLARDWCADHPSLDIVLERSPAFAYQQAGRYQDLEGSERIDRELDAFLAGLGVEAARFPAHDREGVFRHVRQALLSADRDRQAEPGRAA